MVTLTTQQRDFRKRAIELAQRIAPQYGLDWRLMAAAAILESGWGGSALAREAHNYFAIRAIASTPESRVHVLQAKEGPQRFRKYESMEESFHAYGKLLSQSKYYAGAREACAQVRRSLEPFQELQRQTLLQTFIEHMAPVYCPVDPDYASKLTQIADMLDSE